jgi:hypothetical protein
MSASNDSASVEPLAEPDSATALLPAPEAVPHSTAAAIARCRAAWQQAFDDYVRKNAAKDRWAKDHAAAPAALAYRGALPPLVGHQGIRDFIACVAHGMLMEAIPTERAGQLLYAAQVAIGLIQRTPKSVKSA